MKNFASTIFDDRFLDFKNAQQGLFCAKTAYRRGGMIHLKNAQTYEKADPPLIRKI